MTESATKEEQVLENFNWKKAERKILKRFAPRLDSAPVSLINELGHNTEATLKAIEKCLQDSKYRIVGEKVE